MIDIPIGKAIVVVEYDIDKNGCEDCFMHGKGCHSITCYPHERADGKNVIFKLIDIPKMFNKPTKLQFNQGDINDE